MPATWPDFADYWEDMLGGDALHVLPQARDLAVDIVMKPPVPAALRPAVQLVNQVTIGFLPPTVREPYGSRGTRSARWRSRRAGRASSASCGRCYRIRALQDRKTVAA